MPRCRYCGKSAGWLRKEHRECAERHQKALAAIPRFLLQAIDSDIAPDRFGELLQAVAKDSYISTEDLHALCASGVSEAIARVTRERPLSNTEIQRLTALNDTLANLFPGRDLGQDEQIIKAGIVCDVRNGIIPDCVSITGPVPLKFARDETVLWVFNYVYAVRIPPTSIAELTDGARANGDRYFSPEILSQSHFPENLLNDQIVGDVVVTNRHLFFLQGKGLPLKIPLARVDRLRAYAEGLHLQFESSGKRPSFFGLSDPWFATNVIGALIPPAALAATVETRAEIEPSRSA